MSLESTAEAIAGEKFAWLNPDAHITAKTAFASGAKWAVERVTVEQIADVIDQEIDLALSSRLALAHAIHCLYRGEAGA